MTRFLGTRVAQSKISLPRPHGRGVFAARWSALIGILLIVAGCASSQDSDGSGDWLGGRLGLPSSTSNEQQAAPPLPPTSQDSTPRKLPAIEVFQSGRADGQRIARGGETPRAGDQSLKFDFVNADIREVVRTVLGDMLGVSYSIDEQVAGTITLQSADRVSSEEALAILEDVLTARGFQVADVGAAYRVSAVSNRVPNASTRNMGEDLRFVGLYHISAGEALEILRPLVADRVALNRVTGRNGLLIGGNARDLEHVLELVSVLDVEVLRGKAVALLNPKFAAADQIAKELQSVFENAGVQQGYKPIRFVPIQRLNSVLVIAETQPLVEQALQWMRRLDRADNRGERQLIVYSVQNGRATQVAEVLGTLFGNAGQDDGTIAGTALPAGPDFNPRITADDRNNILLIFATSAEMRIVQSALEQLDVPALQVLIEAVVAEVALTDDLRYGVQWFLQEGDASFTLSSQSSGAVANLFPGFSALVAGTDIRATLSALETVTQVRVMSSPRMMVVNNETARLQVGDQVPIATQSAVERTDVTAPIVNTIQFRDTGVILEVTPRVNQSGMVQLDITQEISDVTATTTSDIDSPTIQQRKFTSSVSVADGETIALGGLIRDRESSGSSGVPFLADIPVFGGLFGTQTSDFRRTEILVLITPRVIQTMDDVREVTRVLRQEFLSNGLWQQ